MHRINEIGFVILLTGMVGMANLAVAGNGKPRMVSSQPAASHKADPTIVVVGKPPAKTQDDPDWANDNHSQMVNPYAPISDASKQCYLPGTYIIKPDNAGYCGGPPPAFAAFEAGRAYILAHDHSLQDAYAALDAGDDAKAFRLFKQAHSRIGFPQAALQVADMYLHGRGTPPDTQRAIAWYRRVTDAPFHPFEAQKFHAYDPEYLNTRSTAAISLAQIYRYGTGIGKNPPAVRHWYGRADTFGAIPATYQLAQIWRAGYGGAADMDKALKLFTKASDIGYAPARFTLGVLYYNGEGVGQDRAKSLDLWRKGAAQGDRDALYAMGLMYDRGEAGGKPDAETALAYYKQAALKGQPDAEEALAMSFYSGEDVPEDKTLARKWFELAARQDDPQAMFNLGVMLAHGEGGPEDDVQAYVWFSLAARSGMDQATAAATEIAVHLTPQDRAKAEAILQG